MQSIYIHHNTIKVVGKLGVNFRWSAVACDRFSFLGTAMLNGIVWIRRRLHVLTILPLGNYSDAVAHDRRKEPKAVASDRTPKRCAPRYDC